MPGYAELLILAVVIVLLFGSKQLPSIARSLGKGVRDVRGTLDDVDPRKAVARALEAPEDEATVARGERPRDERSERSKRRP